MRKEREATFEAATPAYASGYPVVDEFDDYEVSEGLLRGIYAYGFERPSGIQQVGILPILDGRDTIQQAQSGTGKTVAYLIGALQRVDYAVEASPTQVLILAPTRELALQIHNVTLALGEYVGVRCCCSIGGTSVRDNMDELRKGPHVVVGMPGRVYDMIAKRRLRPEALRLIVLDEADELLGRTHQDQVYTILKSLPKEVQVVLASATFPPELLERTAKFMRDSVRILVPREELMLQGIRHFYIALEKEEWKLDTLCDLYESLITTQCIVFANSRRKVDFIAEHMQKSKLTASILHAELDQLERNLVMREFRSGTARVLITTGMLSRGIDVPQVSSVVNFDLPQSVEEYLHRAGRAGRFGRKGCVVNFVTNSDTRTMKDVEAYYNIQVEDCPMNLADLL